MECKRINIPELSIDLALSNSPFFHSSRQIHEDIVEDFSKFIDAVNKSLRICLEGSSGICMHDIDDWLGLNENFKCFINELSRMQEMHDPCMVGVRIDHH